MVGRVDMSDDVKYQQLVKAHIDTLVPIFARASVGDFSQDVPIVTQEDEFTGLEVGVQIMLDVIREKIKNYEDVNRQLRERYEEKNALLQSIADGVVVLDKVGKVTFVNHAGQNLMGWAEAEMVGKKWSDLIPLERVDGTRVSNDLRPIMVAYPPNIQGGVAETLYYVRKNGTRFPVSATLARVMLEGQDLGSIVVFRDVTREKEVEELKEDFLSLATHQLRSPLVTMRWTMEALIEGIGTQIPDEAKKKINIIYQNNQHMIGLVNDILSVSRINQGRMQEQKQPHNLVRLLENTTVQMQPEALHRQIKLVVKVEDDKLKDRRYLVDASLFSHCMQNVISNAIKYGKSGTDVNLTLSSKDDRICFAVTDQGVGIPKTDIEHIFEKFYRGQNVSQMDVPGSGLGLFVVKSIIDRWGGTISLESQENVGTTVTMCVPFEVV